MNTWLFRKSLVLVGLLFLANEFRAPAQDGIYADLSTSMGSITCRLDYATAPKAVANFVGLATGQRAWLDLTSGLARTNPFYNGIILHRVITNFVIQAGSPDGTGADGPGYAFTDEIRTSVKFDAFGKLAMANNGTNSNGSQFFITMAAASSLNNSYTIFGQVVGGSNVVYAINHVATDANNKPTNNVVIQSVGIRRVGTAAQAFDIHAQGLPVVTNQPVSIVAAPGNRWVVSWSTNRQYADNRLYVSPSLPTWSEEGLGIDLNPVVTNSIYRSNELSQSFFRLAQIQYSSSTLSPKDLYGRLLTFPLKNASTSIGTLKITFDSSGGGTYTYSNSSGTETGTVTSYSWTQQPYRGFLWPVYFSGLVVPPMTMQLDFTSATKGRMSGTAYDRLPFAISASFTISP